eukprot:4067637-Pyramimonas_sp.AAC.1
MGHGAGGMAHCAAAPGAQQIEFAIDGSRPKPAPLESQRAGWATVLSDPAGDRPLRVMRAA